MRLRTETLNHCVNIKMEGVRSSQKVKQAGVLPLPQYCSFVSRLLLSSLVLQTTSLAKDNLAILPSFLYHWKKWRHSVHHVMSVQGLNHIKNSLCGVLKDGRSVHLLM